MIEKCIGLCTSVVVARSIFIIYLISNCVNFVGALFVSLVVTPIVSIATLLHLPKFYALLIGNLFTLDSQLTHYTLFFFLLIFTFLYSESAVMFNLSVSPYISLIKCQNLSNVLSIFTISCSVAKLRLLHVCDAFT